MKRMISIVLSAVLAFGLTACGTGAAADSQTENTGSISAEEQSSSEESEDSNTEKHSAASQSDSRILIAYFSVPEDTGTDGTDAVAGASIVVSEGEKLGNTEYVAEVIRETVGGDLFRIETEDD